MARYCLPVVLSLVLLLTLVDAPRLHAFSDKSAGAECAKCHTLSQEDAAALLSKLGAAGAKIVEIRTSPVQGIWELTVEDRGRAGVLYLDFSKKYVFSGQVIEVATRANKTAEQIQKVQDSKRIDVASIPLENALVMGDPKAPKKVIVFTDPDCPFCEKLHNELKKVIETRKDIAFYLKLYPLPMHKDAYWKSKSIVCKKSIQLLEDNFAKKPIEKVECDTKEVDDTLKLTEKLGIGGTPAIVLPDGRLRSGAMPADQLIQLVDGK